MKKLTFSKLFLSVLLMLSFTSVDAQVLKPFSVRFDNGGAGLQGDQVLIGNNILSKDNNDFNDDDLNSDVDMQYVDIDGDASTFSSSSAVLTIPNSNAPGAPCYKVAYAALYWSAIIRNNDLATDRTKFTQIKFKMPVGGYNDINGQLVYDVRDHATGISGNTSKPYVCYADVTALLNGLGSPNGTYSVANVTSSLGSNGGTGLSAGWSLYVVYEDPKLPARYFTSFDGFSGITRNTATLDIDINGFKTIPVGPVRANFAFAALEGDKGISGDYLQINGTPISAVNNALTTIRSATNFFNSSVTYIDPVTKKTENFLNRTPASTNTLGYDAGIINIPNGGNSVIANNATSARITLGSTQDAYFYYFNAFAVEIVEPNIVLTKVVQNSAGTDIGGTNVTFGEILNYVVSFQNTGNDDATSFTIRDVLPINIIFNYPADPAAITLPAGVTIKSYNPSTREIVFDVDQNLVQQNDGPTSIRFKVQVVSGCNELDDACSNIIDNIAYATYSGSLNPGFVKTDDPSVNSNTGCVLVSKATNFLVGIDGCVYSTDVTLCGDSTVLTAGNGYDTYAWSKFPFDGVGNPTGPILGTSQSFTVTDIGAYYVRNTAIAPCRSITQQFNVTRFGGLVANPIIPFADQVVTCANDGKLLPNIYLCGGADSRLIRIGITGTSSMVWERLTGGCTTTANPTCASESASCTWTTVGTGPDFVADTSGEYRLVLNYSGGCFNRFNFNVYKNSFTPTATVTDIFCITPGTIVVNNPAQGTGYEYSLSPTGPFVATNTFTINTAGNYTAYVKQIGVPSNPCIFEVKNLQVLYRNIAVQEIVDQPNCKGDKGTITLNVNNVRAQYYLSLRKGASVLVSPIPQASNQFVISNLDIGTYDYTVTTDDGCTQSGTIAIIEPALLTATAALTKPLTCTNGEITVSPVGGTSPYYYFINGNPTFQTSAQIAVTNPLPVGGVYNIRVVDNNNCETTTSIVVTANPKPVYTVTPTNVLCYGVNSGTINFNVTNANGYTLAYSIDNGTTYVPNGTFSNLAPGTYTPILRYTLNGENCFDPLPAITITQPIQLTASIASTVLTCSPLGPVSAVVTVTASGGTGILQYSFNGNTNFTTANTFSTGTAGTVTAYVRDANNCQFGPLSVVISPKNVITAIDVFFETGLECPAYEAHVKFQAVGGVPQIDYQIVSGPAGFSSAVVQDGEFKFLKPGDYIFRATDRNGCSFDRPYHVKGVPDIVAGGSVLTPIKCFGDKGTIQFTVNGVKDRGYDYVIRNAANVIIQSANNVNETVTTINVAAAQPAGVYTITAIDRKTNCPATYSITLSQPLAALSIPNVVGTNVNCNNDISQITVTAAGGTPNYSYAYLPAGSAAVPTYNLGNVLNIDTANGTVLSWDIYVKDANDCTTSRRVTIGSDPVPTVTAVVNNQCSGTGSAFTITATGTGGIAPLTYGINGVTGAFQSGTTFTVAPGTYTVWVKDANGCTASIGSPIIISPQLTAVSAVTKTVDCSASPAAVITTTITGGAAPYTYTVQKGLGVPSAASASSAALTFTYSVSNANADTYTFVITDANGCTSTTSATVSPITNPTVAATPTQVSCNGGTNGSVNLVGAGGSGGYTYSFNGSAFTATTNYTGLSAGIAYAYQVMDSKGCVSAAATITLTQPTVLLVSASATTFSCSATNTKQAAVVTIAVPTTGTSPYEYSFNGGGYTNANTLTVNDNGTAQTINYSVRDANGCITSGSLIINRLNPPTDLTFANIAVTCSAPTTTVTLTAVNGVGTLQYETIAPSVVIIPKQTSNVFAGLSSGNYTFRVTDANGCYYTESYTITPVVPIAIAGNVTANVNCKGSATGSASFSVSGNAIIGGYTFVLTAGTLGTGTLTKAGNTLSLSNVVAGSYTVQVTDTATGCIEDATVVITEPLNNLAITSAIATTINCNNDNSQITVTATGGTINYSYAAVISGSAAPVVYAASNVITVDTNTGANLVWDVYVKDANGCITNAPVTVISDALPTVTVLVDNQCTASGSTFTITATGTGLAPLTYGIGGPAGAFQASPTFTVPAGTYTVSIKDKNGCIVAATATTVYPQLTAVSAVTKTLDCSVSPNAIIAGTISGGRSPFTVVVLAGTGPGTISQPTATTFSYTTAVASAYTFQITDANGCQTTVSSTISPITNPTVTATPTMVTCFGLANGSVNLVGAGGSGGYTYSFNGSAFSATTNYTGLSAGIAYAYQVMDSKGCVSAAATITLTQPTALLVSASATTFSCSATNTKQAAVVTIAVPTTGTSPYEYSFNGGGYTNTNTLTINDNGTDQTINYSVRDANGCITSGNVIINRLNPATDLGFTPSAAITCTTTSVAVQLTTTNGVAPLSYVITSGPVINASGAASGNFTGLTPGTYVFRVTDANGCYYSESHTIAPVTPIAVSATKLTDVDCKGGTTGSGRFTVTGFSSTGNYAITVTSVPAALPYITTTIGDVHTLTGLVAGTYTFNVTDNTTGCPASTSVIITEPVLALSITNATATNVFCTNDNSQITVTATGGTPNYGYAAVISGAPAPATFAPANVITVDTNSGANLAWDVYVRDAKGCITQTPVTIINNGSPTVTASVANQCSVSGSAFQIVAVGAGGLAPYTYTINTGVAPSPANIFTVAAGTYTITATDANGCPATTTITVNQALTATAIVTKDITCSLPQEATIKVDVLGGLAPFGYKVKIGLGSYSGAPIPFAGTTFNYTPSSLIGTSYEFEITDANGIPCTALTNVVTTNSITPVTATETHVNPRCNGFTDGSIRLTATAGEASFTYAIAVAPATPTSFGSSNVFGGLAAGTYNYIVRDTKGCDATGTITLVNPPAILVNIVRNAIQCNTNTPGSFDVNVLSGGTAPYVYTLYDNSFTPIGLPFTEVSAATTPVHSFGGLNFGDYYITVVDANGCEFKSSKLRIETPPFLTMTATVDSNNCATGVNVTVTTSGGTGPYRYSIFGQPLTETAPLASTSYTFTGLLHGVTYFLQVKDVFNCISILEFTTPPPPSTINIVVTNDEDVTCNGFSNGILAFRVQGYDATVTNINYEVVNALTLLPLVPAISGTLIGGLGGPVSGNITTLPAGNYVLKVTEATGTLCSATYTFQITQPAQPLTSAVTSNVNATCNSRALVTLTTTGGTGPYVYAYDLAPTVPSGGHTAGNVITLDYNLGTSWIIQVKDFNGCTFNVPVTIAKDPVPVIALSIVNKCVAQGAFGILVTETTAGTGAYTISVDGSTFISIPSLPHTVTGLNSGSHTIIIKDVNGCTDSETIIIDAPLIATPSITTLPTCANNNGVITMSGTGGTGTYTYSISPVAGVIAGNVISALPAGTYTVTMTDTAVPTNCITTAVVTLVAAIPVTFTTTTTPALCVGYSNGSITVTLLPGNNNPSYSYEIIAGPQLAVAQSSNLFNGLLPGSYTVRVNSGRGCTTDVANVIVAPATPLTASAAFPANTTCSTATVITVTAGGGTGTGYLYNFNGLGYTSDPTYTVNENGSIQTISYTVKDSNGCVTAPQTIDVNPLNKPTDLVFVVSTAPTCPAPTTGVTVTATNGVGALTFAIIQFNGAPTALYPPQTTAGFAVSAVFNNLPAGDYMFQVTDSFGCTYQESHTVAPVTPIAIVGTLVNDISCNVANGTTNNGSASFTVTGFSASGNYSIAVTSVPAALPFTQTAVGDVITYTGLSAGTYTVAVTDLTTGCTDNDFITITLPTPITFTATPTKVFCSQDISTITVSAVTGGTGVYSYAVVPGGAIAPLAGAYNNNPLLSVDTNLTALSWDVYVKDANGCIAMQNVVVTNNAPPTIVAPAALCYVGAPLTVDLSPNTITTTYNGTKFYTVNGSAIATSIATFNTPGIYVLGIKDDNGCEAFVNYTIEKQILANAVLTKDLYCAAPVNATIDVTITDGVAPYNYQMYIGGVASGGLTPVAGSTFTASVVAAGSYTFVITDSNAATCTVTTNAVLVSTPSMPTFSAVPTNVTCYAGTDGTITITPANGVAPYTFVLSGVGANTTGDATGIYTGLAAGSYTVVVTDAKGCTSIAVAAIPIIAPADVTATISVVTGLSCGVGNVTQPATVEVIASGGTGPYQYNFNGLGYTSTNTFTTNTPGVVTALVIDANGCLIAAAVSIPVIPLNPPTDMNINGTPVYCAPIANTTSTVTITTTNGVGTLAYVILSPAGAIGNISGATSGIFTLLAPDTYTFQVMDANGCTYQESYTVAPVTPIAIVGALVNDITCNGANGTTNNGSASFTVTGFSASGNYSISVTSVPAALPFTQTAVGDVITLTGLSAGTYTVTVTDITTGCTEDDLVTIILPTPIVFTTTSTKVFCSQDISTITVSAVAGGTGVYSYAVVPGGAIAPLAGAYNNSPLLSVDTNLTALSWDVYVKDANGCIAMQNVVITNDAPPTIVAPAAQCYVGAALTVDLSPNTITTTYNGTEFYTVNGSAIATSIATFNTPGTYVLGIKDDNGCEAFVNYTIEKQILANAVLTKDLYCAAPVNATIAVTITDGVAPYNYQMYIGGVASGGFTAVAGSTFTASVGAVGSYTFVITDSNAATCTVTTNAVIVTTPVNPTAGFVQTNITCIGQTDGKITITPSNGIAPYTFALTGVGANTTGDATGIYTGLPAGMYSFVVTDAKNCTFTNNVTITLPVALTATAVVTPFGCSIANAPQDAIVTITPVGGTGSHSYSFDGGVTFQASASFTVNAAQTINYVVLDANGCIFPGTAVVLPYTPPTDMDLTQAPIYCSTIPAQTTVTVNSVVGGVGPFVFEIISPAAAATAPSAPTAAPFSFANLGVGIYVIKVTDASGCSTTKAFTVVESDKIEVTAQLINDVYCNGASTGILEFTVANYITAGNYTFNLVPNLGVMTKTGDVIRYTNLPAGNYTITVMDTTSGCMDTASYGVSEPAILTLNERHTEITCVPGSDGTISVTATGGMSGGYEFELLNGVAIVQPYGPNASWRGLTVGSYTVNVKDSKGCVDTETVVLNNPTSISFTTTITNAGLLCKGDTNASITVDPTVTGGQGSNYSYTLNTASATPVIINGPQASNVFNNLGAGTYTVTVTDGWGCGTTSAIPIVITEPTEVIASLALASTQTCSVLSTLTLSATGGTGLYEYSTTPNFVVVLGSFASSTTIFNVPVGTFRYYVRDANGCSSFITNDIKIDPLVPLSISLEKANPVINCAGDSAGIIVATAQGGLGNYAYTLTNGTTGTVTGPQPTGNFTGLLAGTYNVHVDSGVDCSEDVLVTITQPSTVFAASASAIPVTCNGNGDGKIMITASGGTGIITYAISPRLDQWFVGNSVGGHSFNNLTPGSYDVMAQDVNGCFHIETLVITQPPAIIPTLVANSVQQELCVGEKTGAFSITIIGGVPPYSTSLDNYTGVYIQDQFDFAGLSGGNHTVYIKDANLCEYEMLVALDPAVVLDPVAIPTYDCVNDLPANKVTVTIDASNTDPSLVKYSLDGNLNQQSTNVFVNVPAGDHFVVVEHSNGCVDSTPIFNVLQVEPLSITIDLGGLNEIVATVTGGSGVYSFSVNGVDIGSNNKYIYFKSGDYTVTVTDSNGCVAAATKYFEFIDIIIPPIFTPTGDGTNDTWKPTNTENYPDIKFIVYDRYGREVGVFGAGQSWDGKYNGTELPMGDYWYVLKLKHSQDDREFIGHFTLYR